MEIDLSESTSIVLLNDGIFLFIYRLKLLTDIIPKKIEIQNNVQ